MTKLAGQRDETRTDAAIQEAVLAELRWDGRVHGEDVGVWVGDGVVTLTGTVGSHAERIAAQEVVHGVAGVLDVANEISVEPRGAHIRTDTELAQAVRRALEWDALVPQERIHSTVADGWITLEGEVAHPFQRDHAEFAVRQLVGIRGVTNKVKLVHPPVRAQQLRAEIERALERRADREARRLGIAVSDGTVILTGPVRSLAERRAVLGTVRHTLGVRSVIDHLIVDPFA